MKGFIIRCCFFFIIPMLPLELSAQVTYKVQGCVIGISADIKIYLLKQTGDIDSAIAHAPDGIFSFSGTCANRTFSAIVLEQLSNFDQTNKYVRLFLDGTDTRITGTVNDFNSALVEGSALNADSREYDKYLSRAIDENSPNSKEKFERKATAIILYMNNHPASYRGVAESFFVKQYLSIEQLRMVYQRTSRDNKRSEIGKLLNHYILSYNKAEIGNKAPVFSLKDLNGSTINLKDYHGKYVLLEFWSNSCGPCREENPLVSELYAKYKSLGFEVLGMGMGKKEALVEAARKDGNTWNSAVLTTLDKKMIEYNVVSIPYSVLIDREGKIIARGLRESREDEKQKISTRLREIFSGERKSMNADSTSVRH